MTRVARLRTSPSAQGVLLVAPTIGWLTLFLVLPLVLIAIISFATRAPDGSIAYRFTLDNYRDLARPEYLRVLWDSVWIALVTTVACLLLGYPAAWFIARSHPARRTLYLFLILVPFWTNFLIRIYAWRVILQSEGVLAAALPLAGPLRPLAAQLFGLVRLNTPGAVMLGMVYEFLPFMVLPVYTSLEKLDPDLLEAAADLGARPWRAFWRVTWPLSLPGVVAGSILTFVPAMGMFVVPDLLGGARTVLIGNLIRNQFLSELHWPLGSAASLVLMLFTLLVTLYYTRRFGFAEELTA
jgi:spermidine/putrescine transport system permease protein